MKNYMMSYPKTLTAAVVVVLMACSVAFAAPPAVHTVKIEDAAVSTTEGGSPTEFLGDNDSGKQKLDADEAFVFVPFNETGIYNPQELINPFNPPFGSLTKASGQKKGRLKTSGPQSPLELIDLSQIKLVAILSSADSAYALVQDTTKKGYVVSPGSAIGQNSGVVSKIAEDRIFIEEEEADMFGKTTKKVKELKLQKPAGVN